VMGHHPSESGSARLVSRAAPRITCGRLALTMSFATSFGVVRRTRTTSRAPSDAFLTSSPCDGSLSIESEGPVSINSPGAMSSSPRRTPLATSHP
jgi:hypothetical protein